MPRDAVSRTANVECNGGHKWVNRRMDSSAQFAANYELLDTRHHRACVTYELKMYLFNNL